ncbi:hypothetical protein [Dyadobacter sp. 676]|uniref:Uncharacterized protein n=1 Tax=Dyadobacter sp. 676 TaxID=3088362 RepID=A0AAU8FI17_9BACT
MARNELNNIRRRIKDAEANQENPIIAELRRRKEELDTEIVRIDDTVDSLNREIGEFLNEKTQRAKRIEELSKKIKCFGEK